MSDIAFGAVPIGMPLETKLLRASVETVARDGTFEGYASIFGNEDQGGDIVAPGAFGRSLTARPAGQVRMLWQHDPAEPIGVWEHVEEDARGLLVRGRLLPDVERAREVQSLMRAGAIDGLSIGFRAVRSRTDAHTGARTLLDVDLWEISVVTFPMNEAARVAGVKQLTTLRGFESFLRDAGGFSRAEAKRVAALGFVGISEQRDAAPDLALLAAAIRRANERMKL